MAIRKITECDLCGYEVGSEYFKIKATKYNAWFEFGELKYYIICSECKGRLTEILKRLRSAKK